MYVYINIFMCVYVHNCTWIMFSIYNILRLKKIYIHMIMLNKIVCTYIYMSVYMYVYIYI